MNSRWSFRRRPLTRALDICRKMRDAVSSTPFVGDGIAGESHSELRTGFAQGAPKDVKRLAERLLSVPIKHYINARRPAEMASNRRT